MKTGGRQEEDDQGRRTQGHHTLEKESAEPTENQEKSCPLLETKSLTHLYIYIVISDTDNAHAAEMKTHCEDKH